MLPAAGRTGYTLAMTLGRRLGDPRALGNRRVWLSSLRRRQRPHRREERVLLHALLDDGGLRFAPEVEAVLRTNLLTERLRFGDLATFDTELGRMKDFADDVLHSTELLGQLGLVEAGRYMIVGDLDAARAAGERSFQQMADVSSTWNEPSHMVLQLSLMLVSGTLSVLGRRTWPTCSSIRTIPRYLISPLPRRPWASSSAATTNERAN